MTDGRLLWLILLSLYLINKNCHEHFLTDAHENQFGKRSHSYYQS